MAGTKTFYLSEESYNDITKIGEALDIKNRWSDQVNKSEVLRYLIDKELKEIGNEKEN